MDTDVIAGIQQLFDTAQQTAIIFSQTAHDVNLAAATWAGAARSTGDVIRQFKPQTSQIGGEPVAKMDLKETAQTITEAASEIKLVSEELPARTEQIVTQIKSLANHVTINITIPIVVLLCLFTV